VLTLTHAPLTLVFRARGAKDLEAVVAVAVAVAVGEYVSATGQGTEKKWMQILVLMKMKRSIVRVSNRA
jgi:hypothetical protein